VISFLVRWFGYCLHLEAKKADSYSCPPNSLGLGCGKRAKELSLLPLPGDHDDFGDLAGSSFCGTCQHSGPGEFGRASPAGQTEEIEGVGCCSSFAALLRGVMVAKFSKDDGAHGGTFGGRS
jgi:hypothetical protein